MKPLKFTGLISFSVLLAVTAPATPIDLNLNVTQSLASQGWSAGAYFSPSVNYNNTGDTLNWNSMGAGTGPFTGIGYYERGLPTYDANLPWQLTWQVRINNDEPEVPGFYWAGAYTFIGLGGKGVGIGFDRDDLSVFNADGLGWTNLDIAYSHDWRSFVLSGNPLSGAFTLHIDSMLVYQGIMDASGDALYLGDATNGSNVDANTRNWHLTQIPSVPESGSVMTFVALGFGTLIAMRRRFSPKMNRKGSGCGK